MGSSPRVWGQALAFLKSLHVAGIIPTRMGTSKAGGYAVDGLEDHPHAYGDKRSRSCHCQCFAESSPRVWGQALCP